MASGLLAVLAAGALLLPAAQVQAQEASWFHVRVEDPEATHLNLNLPLSMIEVGLEMADGQIMQGEGAPWERDGAPDLDEVRRIWAELRHAGDGDLVEVADGESHVRISRRADRVHLRVDEGERRIRAEMPTVVVDALLGSGGDQLDLPAAVRELARSGRQDLLDLRDGETTIRVWISDGRTEGSGR